MCNVSEHEKDMGNVLECLWDTSVYVVNDFYSTAKRLNFVMRLATY